MATVETGPFFFAWVDADETTFTDAHKRVDEYIFKARMEHREGEIPELTLDIENPKVPLLGTGRKTWAWLAWRDDYGVGYLRIPGWVYLLFFGRLLGIPNDVFKEVITLKFLARAQNFKAKERALGQTLKVRPYWEPVWVDLAKQSDFVSITEGYSARRHVDRVTLAITISDILNGEDGTEVFNADDAFYDSVKQKIGQVAATAIRVDANVPWTQVASGGIDLAATTIDSYTGDGLIGDWPKPYSSLGGGWSVSRSFAYDVFGVDLASSVTKTGHWQNNEKTHEDGDPLSHDVSVTFPDRGGGAIVGSSFTNNVTQQEGATGPSSHSISETHTIQMLFRVKGALSLHYDAKRERSEHISFTVGADLQSLLTDPIESEETETITLNGLNVGVPMFARALLTSNVDNVSDGNTVTILDDIYTFQSSLTPGRGHVKIGADAQDSLTNLVNAINVNDIGAPGVDFSFDCVPSEYVSAEPPSANAAMVTALSPTTKVTVAAVAPTLAWVSPYAWTLRHGLPLLGLAIGSQSYHFVVVLTEDTEPYKSAGISIPGEILIEPGSLEGTLINLAAAINGDGGAGQAYSSGTYRNEIAAADSVRGELTVYPRTPAALPHFVVGPSDNWTRNVTELAPDPTSIAIEDVSRRSYFPTERGQWSIEALLMRARAHLRQRARAVEVSFDCAFERAISLSCRKSATLADARLSGGTATGKVTSYGFEVDGDKGAQIGHVTIGCGIGNGGAPVLPAGDPTWATADYAGPDYQVFAGRMQAAAPEDIGYERPLDAPDDDGLVFPLRPDQAVLADEWHEDVNTQAASLETIRRSRTENGEIDASKLQQWYRSQVSSAQNALINKRIWRMIILHSVTNGPFDARYDLATTKLSIDKGIALS